MTREQWLQQAIDELRPKFKAACYPLPKTIHVSVGLPKGRKAIGECWHGQASEDGNKHVFISPTLGDVAEVLDTLVHELVHVALPAGIGHKKPFVRAGQALGLTEGKATSLGAGYVLAQELRALATKLGEYPHSKLDVSTLAKKQSTRLLKAECPICGYTVRTTKKWFEYAGAPLCPAEQCEKIQMVSDYQPETEEGEDENDDE